MERQFSIGPEGVFIPFPPPAIGTILWTLGYLGAGLAAFSFLAYWLWPRVARYTDLALDGLGYGDALPRPVALPLGAMWIVLFFTLSAGVFYTLARLARLGLVTESGDALDLRWSLLTLSVTTATLGAVVALPMTLARVSYARRQTRTAEENLTTDLINKAVEGLGATKEVNRLGRNVVIERGGQQHTAFNWIDEPLYLEDGDKIIDEETSLFSPIALTQPNIEVRLGAIYSLERIARDRAATGKPEGAADHVRVMEILCAYIRENAPAHSARDHELGEFRSAPPTDNQRLENWYLERLLQRMRDLRKWAEAVRIEQAVDFR